MLECFFTKFVVLLVVTMECCCGAAMAYPIAKEGCPDECGGLQIPYPFGIGDGCFFNQTYSSLPPHGYRINCDHTTNPPIPYLGIGGIKYEVLSINFDDPSLRVSSGVAYECYENGKLVASSTPLFMSNNHLFLSYRNMFVSVGCDIVASFYDDYSPYTKEGCKTSCIDSEVVRNGTCDSVHGCCEVSTLGAVLGFRIEFGGSSGHNKACHFAFFSEVGWFNFSAANLTTTPSDCDKIRVPMVYDLDLYKIRDLGYCGSNTNASDFGCQCLEGYTGNPYLGCQDINECMDGKLNDCPKGEVCVNTIGGYECRCPGHHGSSTLTSQCIVDNGVANEVAKPWCPGECFGVKIPFPFGIGSGCFASGMPELEITCDDTNRKPVLPHLGNREVLSIDTENHTIRLSYGVDYQCYNSNLYAITHHNTLASDTTYPFNVLPTRNKFVVVGCMASAWLINNVGEGEVVSACSTSCIYNEVVSHGTCDSDLGCCEAPILLNLSNPSIDISNKSTNYSLYEEASCNYAFVGEVGSYNFYEAGLATTPDECDKIRVPVLYEWYVASITITNCSEIKMYRDGYYLSTMCRSNTHIECVDKNDFGYRCQCMEGYDGNPYLSHGCQDINECLEESLNDCQRPAFCVNKDGGYDCKCPRRHHGNGTTTSPCIPSPVNNLILGACIGASSVIGSILALYGMYKLIKRGKDAKEREDNFERNGGLLLQQKNSANEVAIDGAKVFSRRDLEKATDNFNNNRVLGRGGQGVVYKGMLEDGTIVAVKKSKKVDENQLGQFINEVVILSQISHRNVVKLFGCCLETEVPMLVYEFVPNGTLHQHIHQPSEVFYMTWKVRFQIAMECAGAIAYLHSSCSSPIYHRDIKSSNILLDEKYKAKVSDFGTSRTICTDKTHVTTCVQGTFGYLDPEFFRSSQFSEKSDVYSFGVVLLELLTSKKPIFTNTSTDHLGLATEFQQLMETSPHQLHGFLDAKVLQQCSEEEIEALTKLIEQCLSLYGKQRPTMREVVRTLEMIYSQHEGNPANDQEEGCVIWTDHMSVTNEDPYSSSAFTDTSCSMNP